MLKDIYPDYQDSVDFYVVGIAGEPLSELVKFKEEQNYPWPIAKAPPRLAPDYNIRQTSSKVAIDGNGLIIFSESYSVEARDTWVRLFQELSGV